MNGDENSILFHRRSKNCDPADSPLASQNHCHCQDCLVLSSPSTRQPPQLLTDDSGLCIRACLISSFGSELLLYTHLDETLTRRKGAHIPKPGDLQPSCKHGSVLSHRPAGHRLGGLCVLFQSSKLLGLGSPLSAYHSATLMATRTLKFYSGLLRGAGGGAEETSPWPCSALPGVTLPFFCYTKDFFKGLCDNGL